jgi:hypothetical protein
VPWFAGNAFLIFLVRQYMRTIPRDLDEAARLEAEALARPRAEPLVALRRVGLAGLVVLAADDQVVEVERGAIRKVNLPGGRIDAFLLQFVSCSADGLDDLTCPAEFRSAKQESAQF